VPAPSKIFLIPHLSETATTFTEGVIGFAKALFNAMIWLTKLHWRHAIPIPIPALDQFVLD
jgi:hypothetical protein